MNNGKEDTIVSKFFHLCRQTKFQKAMLLLLPRQIGPVLTQLMFGDDLQKLITELHNNTEAKQNEIIKRLDDLMALRAGVRQPVIAIGSGYAEIIVESEDEVALGNKHTVGLENLIGGSGANFALRLMAANHPSIPLLPIGNDGTGKYIRQEVGKAMNRANIPEPIQAYVNSDLFLNASISTPTSIILTSRVNRTVFVQKLRGAEHFHAQLESQLDLIDALCDGHTGPVMIGHIQSDRTDGRSTKAVIDRYRNRGLIYAVFGNSQIAHGWEFWDRQGVFKEIGIFQLNCEEAQRFLAEPNRRKSLKDILDWFRTRGVTAVLTMRRLGAIGTFRDLDCLFIAYPLIQADEVVDTTGSGDAFAAGMVSHLWNKKDFNENDFSEAMKIGRIWASCACRSLGGIGKEPEQELAKFLREHPECQRTPIEIKKASYAEEIIRLMDLAQQRTADRNHN